MIFRVRFRFIGAHVECDVFVAPDANRTFVKCGELKLRGAEFEALQRVLQAEFLGAEDK